MDDLITRCKRLWAARGLTEEQIADGIAMLNPEALKRPEMYTDEHILSKAYYPCLWGGLGRAINQYLQWEGKQG